MCFYPFHITGHHIKNGLSLRIICINFEYYTVAPFPYQSNNIVNEICIAHSAKMERRSHVNNVVQKADKNKGQPFLNRYLPSVRRCVTSEISAIQLADARSSSTFNLYSSPTERLLRSHDIFVPEPVFVVSCALKIYRIINFPLISLACSKKIIHMLSRSVP